MFRFVSFRQFWSVMVSGVSRLMEYVHVVCGCPRGVTSRLDDASWVGEVNQIGLSDSTVSVLQYVLVLLLTNFVYQKRYLK